VVTKLGQISEVNATDLVMVLSVLHDSSILLPQESTEVSKRKNPSFMLLVMFTCY